MSLFPSAKSNGRLHFDNAPRVRHRATRPAPVARAKQPESARDLNRAKEPAHARELTEAKRSVPSIDTLAVVSHAGGWALMVDDLEEPAWVVSKKSRAVENASQAARFHACVLQVRSGTGKLQKQLDFTASRER